MATKLERLLRGDKATYRKNEITLVIQHPNAPDEDIRDISVFYVEEKLHIAWFSEEEINNSTDIQFLTPDRPRTIEDGLRKGDLIEYRNDDAVKKKILAVLDDVCIISYSQDHKSVHRVCTIHELITQGWKLVTPEEEKKEELVHLTIKDISEGKGIGVPPHLIRVRE